MTVNRSLLAAPAIVALLLTGVAGLASAAEDPPPPTDPAACEATQAALGEGQGAVERRDAATAALASARADVAALLSEYPEVSFDVQAATVVDVESALGYLRDLRGPDYADDAEINGHMDTVKALRAALIEFSAAAEAALVVDLGALTEARDEACAAPPADDEPSTDPNPTPTADPPAGDADVPPAQIPAGPPYADCDAARADGAAPIMVGDPGYRPALDRDGDGVACDEDRDSDGGSPAVGDAVLGGGDDSNSGVVDRIPAGSIDTGYVA